MTDALGDTSVAIPLLVASHAAHQPVTESLRGRSVALAGHAAYETYAVLTRLPGDARVAPSDAVRLLRERFEPPIVLDLETSRSVPSVLADSGIAGGATYDALVALAARSINLPLLSRDGRAMNTYRLLGVSVELIG